MNIKKYPTERVVYLKDIRKGECFRLTEDYKAPEDDADDSTLDWDREEIFMQCSESWEKLHTVVHLDTGNIAKLPQDLVVESIKAHLYCE